MITTEEIGLLDSPEIREIIAANIARDPHAVALDKKLPHAALVATQIKYLQRARKKLPTYYEARTIIPSLAFEQASSEQTAAHRSWGGDLCIDLTCGLGVDSLHLSKSFERVITVERNEALAATARINFARMGVSNMEVIHDTAEHFLHDFHEAGGRADLIYADPDRRAEDGRKLVRIEECRPDINALMPMLRQCAPVMAVKMSPLFDVNEAFRLFGNDCTVEVVSLGGECKEVLIEIGGATHGAIVRASAIGRGTVEYPFVPSHPAVNSIQFQPPYRYIVIPDVALRKARITTEYAASHLPNSYATPGEGYIFTNELPLCDDQPIIGKVFEVVAIDRFDPSVLKKKLRSSGIKSVELHTHDFPLSAPELAKKLGIREGGGAKMAFSRIASTLWVIELKEVFL